MEKINYEELHYKVRIYKVNPIVPYFNVKKIRNTNYLGTVRIYKKEEININSISGQENAFFIDTGIEFVATQTYKKIFDIVGVNQTCSSFATSIEEVRFIKEQVAKVYRPNARLYAAVEKILSDREVEEFYWRTLTTAKIAEQIKLLENLHQEAYQYWNPIPGKKHVKMIEQMRK